jgi:hypothetical protein
MGRTLDNCKLQRQADTCSSYGFVGIATGALTKGHTLDMVGEHGVGSPGQHKSCGNWKGVFWRFESTEGKYQAGRKSLPILSLPSFSSRSLCVWE